MEKRGAAGNIIMRALRERMPILTRRDRAKMRHWLRMDDRNSLYKAFEEDKNLGLTNQESQYFWTVCGEAVAFYGTTITFETKETLEGKAKGNRRGRPAFMNRLLDDYLRKKLLKVFPKKCEYCGFHRFFAIELEHTSIGEGVAVACPNCKMILKEIEIDY